MGEKTNVTAPGKSITNFTGEVTAALVATPSLAVTRTAIWSPRSPLPATDRSRVDRSRPRCRGRSWPLVVVGERVAVVVVRDDVGRGRVGRTCARVVIVTESTTGALLPTLAVSMTGSPSSSRRWA